MAAFEQEIRAIPLWLLREYLKELGARPARSGELRGEGWSARLARIEDYRIGSLCVGQVRMELNGDEETIERVRRALEPKLRRAGG